MKKFKYFHLSNEILGVNLAANLAGRLAAELSPREKTQAKSDGGGIHGKQFVFEPEFVVFRRCHLAHVHCFVEEIAKHLPWSMGIGIRKGGFVWWLLHSQVSQLSHGAGQPSTNLSEAFGLGELIEQHRYKMIPRIISLGIPFGLMLLHQVIQL